MFNLCRPLGCSWDRIWRSCRKVDNSDDTIDDEHDDVREGVKKNWQRTVRLTALGGRVTPYLILEPCLTFYDACQFESAFSPKSFLGL